MSLPTDIKNILDLQNVNYAITQMSLDNERFQGASAEAPRDEMDVNSVVLKDGLGKVQVLYPSHCMLDLSVLNQQLVRQLKATTPGDLKPFLDQHNLDSVPALPKFSGFPTVVDERLFNAKSLFLDSGMAGHMLQIGQQDFQRIVSDTTRSNFSVVLNDLQGPFPGDDETQIFDAVKNFTTLRIKKRLEETLELPPLPSTAQRIISLRVDPNADVNDLASIVETDPSLAAQVVSWASSPYYSAPGKIKSIHDAIVRVLGFDMVLNLALGLSLGRSLNMPKDFPNGVAPYWQQAVYTAALMEGLVTAMPRENRPSYGIAYLSGLLNNFGNLVLAEVFPPHLELINRYIEANRHVPVQLIERHLLGVTRSQLASWLMGTWNMPEEIVTALRYQCSFTYSGEHADFANLLFIANAKLMERNIGAGPRIEIPSAFYARLQLDADKAEDTINNIMDSTEELNLIAQQLTT